MDLVMTFLSFAAIFGFATGLYKLLHVIFKKDWLRGCAQLGFSITLLLAALAAILFVYRIDSEGYNWLDGWTWILIGVGVIATFVRNRYSNYDPHNVFDKMNIILMVIGIIIGVRIAFASFMWLTEVTYDTDFVLWSIRSVCLVMFVGSAYAIIYGWKEYEPDYKWLGAFVLICSSPLNYYMWFDLDGLVASLTA